MQKIAAAKSKTALWQIMLEYFHSEGVEMVSYHAVNSDGTPSDIAADGFPEEWVCQYIEQDMVRIDPIPDLASKLSRPFYWHEIGQLVQETAAQKAYLDAMSKAKLGDGLAFYVFGPALQNAYAGLGFGVDYIELDHEAIFALQCVAQAGHLRFCTLNVTTEQPQPLTGREREVLEWVARGKSNSVIADIVGISTHTVDAHIRSIYRKLEVNDRTSAAVKGLGRGLVQYLP